MLEHNTLYKHNPVLYNGVPVLTNNKWCFLLSTDGQYMVNTQYRNFKLPVTPETESEFTKVFCLDEVERVPYNNNVEALNKSDYWVDGVDVAVDDRMTKMTYVWVRKNAKAVPSKAMVTVYKNYKYCQKKFEAATRIWENFCDKYKDDLCVPENMSLEEYVASFVDTNN